MAEQNPFDQFDRDAAPGGASGKANYFDQFDKEPDADDPGLLERARLNSVDAFYRGTIQGSLSLRAMAERVKNPPAQETDPVRLAELGALGAAPYDPNQERSEYEKIVADLARHDAMKSWGSTLEGAAALGGQIAGSLPTPENLLFLPGRGATVLARIARGALEGAVVNVATDPVVQNLNVGVTQKEYDPLRTALAAPLGAVVGGGLVGAGELISKTFLRKKIADLATEDPSFRSADMDAAEASAQPTSTSAELTSTQAPDLNTQASPGSQTNGSPSKIPNLDAIVNNTDVAERAGKPALPGEPESLIGDIERLRTEANAAFDRGDNEAVDEFLRAWEGLRRRLDEIAPDRTAEADRPREAARAGAASPRDAERAGQDLEAAIRGRKPDPRQGDIFGGAKASQGDLAQRGADAPIRPTKAQELIDFGLFGDTASQTDLVDRARGGERSLSQIALRRARERTAEAASAADQSKFITFMRERFGEGWTVEKAGKSEYEAAVRQFIDENPGAAGNMVGFMLTQPRGKKADSGGPERAIFAGENALGADREKLAEAKRIEKELAGGPVTDGNMLVRDLIWFKTGWFRGTDGKWRFEIPDTDLIVQRAAESGDVPTTQSRVISHDALFENYPTLLDGIARWLQSADRNHGMFTPGSMIEAYGSDYVGLSSVAAHELQHAVQTAEGFARGGSPDEFKGILSSLNPDRAKELAYEAYRRLAGETEARNVQARLFLTDQERRARPPYRTEDVERSKQMVVRPDQPVPGQSSAASPAVQAKTADDAARALDEFDTWLTEAFDFDDSPQMRRLSETLMEWHERISNNEAPFATGPGRDLVRVAETLRDGGFFNKFGDDIPESIVDALTGTSRRVKRPPDLPDTSDAASALDMAAFHLDQLNQSDLAGLRKIAEFREEAIRLMADDAEDALRRRSNIDGLFKRIDDAIGDLEQARKTEIKRLEREASANDEDFDLDIDALEATSAIDAVKELKKQLRFAEKKVAKYESFFADTPLAQASEELALAVRKSGDQLAMERARPDAGIPSQVKTGAVATVPNAPAPKDIAIQSLQQQAFALADAIGFPLRQGRNKAGTLATFNTSSGVVRTKEIADFEVVVHEAGHAIEAKVGQDLTDLTNLHAYELGPLDYDHARGSVAEGFAEWMRRYIGNPNHAEQVAPGFTKDFRLMMGAEHPELLRAIDDASKSYRAYLEAPSVDAVGAVVRSKAERQTGWRGVMQRIRTDGMPAVIKTAMQRAYEDVFDDKAPVTRAMRDLARAIRDQEGKPVNLKAADNPEILLRMFERSHQAAVRDMMDGMRGYHSVTPQGPSLSAALEKATGGVNSGGWGKWDTEKVEAFSTYLIARRAIGLWDKFSAGSLQNPPSAFSRADAVVAMAELEKANPAFREASDMVHDWTRRLLKKQFDGGLIDADLFGRLMQEQFYVPFMRDLSDRPLSGSGAVSGAPDQVADTVKRMRGSTRDIISPIESLMTQAFLVNRTLAHNDIIRAFVRFAERSGTEGGRFVEKIPASEARNYSFDLSDSVERLARERGVPADDIRLVTGALSDLFGEDPVVGSFFRMEPAGKRGEPIIFYKEGGETRAARFMSQEEGHALYEVLTALPKPLTDMWSMMIGSTTSLLRAGITTNPMFALTNYIRDQMAVAILRPDYIPVVSGMRGFVQEVGQGEHAVLYGYAGGVSGGASISPVERAVEADINALAKKGYLVNRVTSLKGALELASVTESATRNSVFGKVYEAKKKEGLSDYEAMIEAAFQAQDILDFSRHGSRTDSIRKFVPFINSYFQGMDKARRTIVEPMVRKFRDGDVFAGDQAAFNNALLAATKVFGVGGVLGAGWAALHADSEAYLDASPQVKGTHVVIPFGRNIILWPKPFELGIGFTAGEYAYQMLSQNDPRAAEQFAKAAWDSLTSSSPIYDIPLVKTAFELKSGKNLFTGRDIVPSTLQRLAPEQQYSDRTSSVAKWLGAQIGVSPIKVDYTIGSLFGLWGRDIMAMSSGVDPDAPAQSWEDRVFVRRLIKDPARTSDVTTKFWDFMGQTTGKYNQNVATYDDMVKKFRDDQAGEFLAKLPSSEKAFVIMKSAAKEDGKPAFSSDEKRLHPLQRAYDAVTMLNGIRRELTDNAFKPFKSESRPPLDPVTRRDLIENVRELAQKEMRNSFVIMKEPGYAGRPLFDLAPTMDKIRALSPDVADEIITRYATAKVQKTVDVAKSYPSIRDALIRDGSEADLGDHVTGEYEFGGDRVRKPQKRRVKITPQ